MTLDFNSERSRRTKLQILAAVHDKALTPAQIGAVTGMRESTVDKYISSMRTEGLIHIGGWDELAPGANNRKRMYRAGDKENAPYPHVNPRSSAAHKLCGVATDEELDAVPDWVPLRKATKPVKIQRDWLVAALFGEYRGAAA